MVSAAILGRSALPRLDFRMHLSDDLKGLRMTGVTPSALTSPSEPIREQALASLPASLGSLRELAAWVAACQGVFPPRPLAQCDILAVSSAPDPVLSDGLEPLSVAADASGAQVRRIAVGEATEPMTGLQLTQAMNAGTTAVQNAVAEGADCLVVAGGTSTSEIAALAIIGVLTRTEPVLLVDSPADVDVDEWKRSTVATRNAMFHGRRLRHDPLGLLRTIGTPDIAALTAMLMEAATTRTPLLLDGPVTVAAAMLAHELEPKTKAWWRAGSSSAHRAQRVALDQLELQPVLDLVSSGSEGVGATVALQLVKTAVALCGQPAEPQGEELADDLAATPHSADS